MTTPPYIGPSTKAAVRKQLATGKTTAGERGAEDRARKDATMTAEINQARTDARREANRQAKVPEGFCPVCGRVAQLHDSCEPCPFCEVERLKAPSEIPCCKCGGDVKEFSVPNEAWNVIVRKGGPETDQEYLCLNCFARCAADYIERLQDENGRLYLWKDAAEREYPPIARELADYQRTPRETEQAEQVKRLKAIVKQLPTCWRLVGEGDARRLVRDVSVVPGMRLWTSFRGGEHVCRAVDAVHNVVLGCEPPYPFCGKHITVAAYECYDSPEAAKFAAEAVKGANDG